MIHQYRNNGYNIVLDVNSSSVHIVDDVVYDVLELLDEDDDDRFRDEELERIADEVIPRFPEEKLELSDIRDIFTDLRELEENGSLYTKDVYKEGVIFQEKRDSCQGTLSAYSSRMQSEM